MPRPAKPLRPSPPKEAREAGTQGGAGWHAVAGDEALSALGTRAGGLTEAEAEARLQEHGPNRLPTRAPDSLLERILRQFTNFLIYILLAAAGVSLFLGEIIDAALILAVVIANAAVGFVQEGKAEQSLEAIRRMVDPTALLVRNGQRQELAATGIVPGDIVLIETGDRVPADLRLLDAQNIKAEESVLTGESAPVGKTPAPVPAGAELGDRVSMLFSGTLVVSGTGTGVAVATGPRTELGRISGMIERVTVPETPLLRQMREFSRLLTFAILALAAAVFAYAVLLADYPLDEAFMVVVGLAVAAVPEALPVVLTITLATGVQRMARRNAIIRRLPAVETLGAVSVICSDKTGTLTRNAMTVRALVTAQGRHEVTGEGYDPGGTIEPAEGAEALARTALLCNEAELAEEDGDWRVLGDPMEGALLVLAKKAGLDREEERAASPRIDAIPFDADYKYMATRQEGGAVHIKGAPEAVIAMCDRLAGPDGDAPFDASRWHQEAEKLAREGYRVLAFARARHAGTAPLAHGDLAGDAAFLGLAGLVDPPRGEAKEAVRECRQAGIRVVMITGDHAATAREVARALDLADDPSVLTGRELDRLEEEGFRQAARSTDVFARTTPEHKLRLVEALQADGLTVAMTGDGVNDAPALRRADVGVAMGIKGTEASKEAAAMVLADDNFASISAAVGEGRTIYDNLRKVISWTLPTNGGQALILLFAIAFGLTLPITPVQILWINLVAASALGLTLAFEPAEPGVMERAPRPRNESLLAGELAWRTAFVSFLIAGGGFAAYGWAMSRGLALETARTMVVNAIAAMQIFYLFNVRYVHGTSLTLRGVVGTRIVLIGIAIVVAAQLLFTYWSVMHALFDTRPLGVLEGLVAVLTGVALLLIVEAEKFLRRRLTRRNRRGDAVGRVS